MAPAPVIWYFCGNGTCKFQTRIHYAQCPQCGHTPDKWGEIHVIPKGEGTQAVTPPPVDGWTLTVDDWRYLKSERIDPEQDEPVYR